MCVCMRVFLCVCCKLWVHAECHTERGTLFYMTITSKHRGILFDFSPPFSPSHTHFLSEKLTLRVCLSVPLCFNLWQHLNDE